MKRWAAERWFPLSLSTAVLFLVVLIGATARTAYVATISPTPHNFIDGLLGGLVGAIITLVLAIFTLILVYVAWVQLRVASVQLSNISQTGSADFILRLKRDFFTKKTRILVHLIHRDWLKFVEEGDDSFFQVDEDGINQSGLHDDVKVRLLKRKAFSAYEVDDLVLGHFEDLDTLIQKRVLDRDMVYDMFSWYVEIAWENCEIQKYIRAERKDDNTLWGGFESLYQMCHRISHPLP